MLSFGCHDKPAAVATPVPKSALKAPAANLPAAGSTTAGSTTAGSPAAAKQPAKLRWKDEAGPALEDVKEFRKDDVPMQVGANRDLVVVPGYESAFVQVPPPPQALSEQLSVPAPGPIYYTPSVMSKYPDPDEIGEQRERYLSRPETPELERRRRVTALQEAALTLKPDPYMVPIGVAA